MPKLRALIHPGIATLRPEDPVRRRVSVSFKEWSADNLFAIVGSFVQLVIYVGTVAWFAATVSANLHATQSDVAEVKARQAAFESWSQDRISDLRIRTAVLEAITRVMGGVDPDKVRPTLSE